MNKEIVAATLFSGIGAPEVAAPGWHWAWHAEIEKFPSAVMAARHRQSVNLGDVNADDFAERAAAIAVPDVLVFGSPCQSYSVAGKRLGLDDPRGNLALIALGIVARLAPRWIVFENVPGLLSSSEGRDFGIFLRTVDELGYSGAWASLDAQFFGVAQRRERLFFVGHSGDWRYPAAILLEPESLCGHSPPSRQARKDVAPTIAARTKGGGGLGTDFDCDGGLIAFGGNNTEGPIQVATACNAHGGPHGRLDFESETFIAFAENSRAELRLEGGDGQTISSLKVGGGKPGQSYPAIAFDARQSDVIQYGDKSGPLDTDGHSIAVTVALRGREGGGTAEIGGDLATALRASQGGGDKPHMLTSAIRRLTPKEWARLQGFPDDYLDIVYRGKPAADGPKYKAIGNSMCVNVMRRILSRIELMESRRPQ